MENVDLTIMAQYANSTKLRSLIDTFNLAVEPESFIDNFYDMIWNIETADTYGLNVWGKIVVVSRLLTVEANEIYLGFGEASSIPILVDDPQPFNQAPFYVGKQSSSTVSLSNDAYRKLIMMKAMANITNCTIPNINRMLTYMFGSSGKCYVRNDGGMVMSYVFEFPLSIVELAIVQNSGALPYPAGVTVNIVQQV
ncbi:hypothetical protein SRABI106_01049 [Rahnella aquatilis]|nr:hypothetical protein SRABI106_01049 [Rahnella aquatilis]